MTTSVAEHAPAHLLDLERVGAREIESLLDRAASWRDGAQAPPALHGRTLVTMFYENSTRTRLSFHAAASRLGMTVMDLGVSTSSVAKGESLADTVRTADAIGADVIVIRHGSGDAPHIASGHARGRVVSAGAGSRAHPTQALLDCLTIRDRIGQIRGVRVAIVGDCLHSRVARSNIRALSTLGATVTLVGPRVFVPDDMRAPGVGVAHDLREGLRDAHVVYMLRIQHERQHGQLIPSVHEYRRGFGLDERRLAWAAPNAIVMHPGPVNAGIELSPSLIEHPRSAIRQQVANGVWMRMAVLARATGGMGAANG